MRSAIVDFDGLLYAASTVTEKHWYEVEGSQFSGRTGLKEAKAFCDSHKPKLQYKFIERKSEAEPASHALHVLRGMYRGLRSKVSSIGVKNIESYIGNPDSSKNFRYFWNPGYKGHRPPRPKNFEVVRDYAIDKLGVIVSSPYFETDDEVAIAALDKDSFIVSVDKDFKQIPVDRWNWRTEEWDVAEDRDPNFELCLQLLLGDRVDNIKAGLFRYGYSHIELVQRRRTEGASLAKIADEIGSGTTAVKKMLSIDLSKSGSHGYGSLGSKVARQILLSYKDNPMLAVIDQYEEIFREDWEENLNRVGNQVYLLRSPTDSFNYESFL